jgi:hypothetical protein
MPRDLLAGLATAPRKPRDLFADGGASAPVPTAAQPPSAVETAMRGNPLTAGLAAGYRALPDWLQSSLGSDASRVGNSLIDAIMAPSDALTNRTGMQDIQIDPVTGQPQPINDQMLQRASNAAGFMTPGELHPSLLPGLGEKMTMADGKPVPSKVLSAVARDQIAPTDVAGRVQDLGDAAVVADIGDNTQKLAAGVASQPGEAGARVTNQLKTRAKDSTNRVPTAIDGALGPATPPSEIHADIAANKGEVGPEYDVVLDKAAPVDPTALAAEVDARIATKKGPVRSALQEVRSMLNVAGANATDQMDRLDTSARGLFETRNAIDGMITPTGNTKVNGALKDVRKQIDALLEAAVPGIKDIDAKYRELARQGEALDAGGNVLDAGKTAVWPQENAQALADGVQPQGTLVGPSAAAFRLKQGTRADIERIVGTKLNDRTALAQMIQGESDWNFQKLAQEFGQDKADQLMKVVENERQKAGTENLAINGSKTAAVTAAQQDVNGAAPKPSDAKGRTLLDLVFGAADKLTMGMTEARRAQMNSDIVDAIMGAGDWTRRPGAGAMSVIQPLETALANGGGNRHDPLTEAIMRGRRP